MPEKKEEVPQDLRDSGWRPMSSAPRDGTMILVCELAGGEHINVMPACYMRANGNPDLEDFWGVWPTSRVPVHLMAEFPNIEGFAVGWKNIALTPLCWMPLPMPESFAKLRRRQAQILHHKYKGANGTVAA